MALVHRQEFIEGFLSAEEKMVTEIVIIYCLCSESPLYIEGCSDEGNGSAPAHTCDLGTKVNPTVISANRCVRYVQEILLPLHTPSLILPHRILGCQLYEAERY